MQNLTLRQEVAQMVIPRLNGETLSDPWHFSQVSKLIQEGIGGFILFGGNVEHTPRHLQALQSLSQVPLLIASDVERGLGQQLYGGTRFPSQRAVSAAVDRRSKKDVELLEAMLDAVRTETRAAGIHAVFSPVVDVNNNPDNPIICTRAFGDDPATVEWFGTRYIKGLQKTRGAKGRQDLLACAKHFPGHGDTDQDSHSVLPVIHADRARLNRVELPPFRESVRSGVDMVMVAHLQVPSLDPDKPTTFSTKIITALLREGMEFDGLIVSDALDMGALSGAYSADEIAVRTVEAGMDILLHPPDALLTINAVVAAVEQGRLTRQRIRESVARIKTAKTILGLFDKSGRAAAPVNYKKHRQIAQELGRKSFQVAHGDPKILPLAKDAAVACFVLDDDNDYETGNALIREMRQQFRHFSALVLTPNFDPPESLVNDSIMASEYVLIALFSRISASKGRSGISDKLKATAKNILRAAGAVQAQTIMVSFDSPYVLDRFKEVDLRIAAYDRMNEIQQAVVQRMAGADTAKLRAAKAKPAKRATPKKTKRVAGAPGKKRS